jgi:hypothetical protein
VDEAIEAAQNACIYDNKIYLPRVILAIAHCAQGDAISAKIAWQDAKRIRSELCLADIKWMARPGAIKRLQKIGVH